MKNKSIIKRLALEINKELNGNALINEMGALFDYGQWSESEPSFQNIIKSFKLTPNRLNDLIDEAETYAKIFEDKSPIGSYNMSKHGPYNLNPWLDIIENLHCIFMNDSFE